MNTIISQFITFLISIINIAIQVVFAPIDLLLQNLFPDFSNYISGIDTLLLNLTDYFNYIVSYIPPMTRSLLLLYIAFLISYYFFVLSYKGIMVVIRLIETFKN